MAIQLGPATRGAVLCACFVTMIILNVLSVSLPLGRKTNSEIANANPVYILPAGWAFSIWGLIYILYAALLILFLLPRHGGNPRFREALPWLCANFLVNGAWLVVFQYEFYWLSCPVIAVDLYLVYRAYIALRIGATTRASVAERFASASVSANTAWLLAATLVNFTTTLYINGWTALAPGKDYDANGVDWAVMLVSLAAAVAVGAVLRRGDYVYGAVTLWALWGIYDRQVGVTGTERLTGAIVVATVFIPLATAAALLNRFVGGWWGPPARSLHSPTEDKDVTAFAPALRDLLSEKAQSDDPGVEVRAARRAVRLGGVLARRVEDEEGEEAGGAQAHQGAGAAGDRTPLRTDE